MLRLALAVCVLLLALAAPPALRHIREVPPPPPPPIRLSLLAPLGAELGAGDDLLDAAISADGRQIAFVATTNGVPQLWRRRLGTDRAEPLPGTEGAALPAWKATGRVVAFFAAGKLKQIAIEEGAVRDLADAPAPAGAAWLPDGSLLFVPDAGGPVRRIENGTISDATELQAGDDGHGFPAASDAGGFTYVATLGGGRKVARLVAGEMERELAQTSGHAYLLNNVLVHVRDGTLLAQRFDPERGTLDVRSTPLAFDIGVSSTGKAFYAASPQVVAWASAAPRARDLAWFDLSGMRLGNAGDPADYWQVRLAPDDRSAAVTLLDPLLRTLDIFVLPLTGGPREQLTLALAADTDPVWAPRGDRVLFRSFQDGQPNLFVRQVHAPEAQAETFYRSERDETPSDWRGTMVLFHTPGATGLEVFALDTARGMPQPATRRGFSTYDARWSPDRRRIVYVSDESGRPDIYVEPSPPDGSRVRISFGGGTHPQWARDGRSIFFLRDGRVMRTGLDARPAIPVGDVADVRDYALANHSDRLLAIVPTARSRSQEPSAGIIINWVP
jgi:Tol biopolymer transport system component